MQRLNIISFFKISHSIASKGIFLKEKLSQEDSLRELKDLLQKFFWKKFSLLFFSENI